MSEDEYDLSADASAPLPKSRATTTASTSGSGYYAQDRLLIVHDGAVLPDRCIKCNAPAAEGRLNKRLLYDIPVERSGAMGCIPIVNRIYAFYWLFKKINAGIVHFNVSFCLCSKHRMMRLIGWIAMSVAIPAGMCLFIYGIAKSDPVNQIIGLVIFFVGVAFGAAGVPLLSVVTVERNSAHLKGARPRFLESLPKPKPIRPKQWR